MTAACGTFPNDLNRCKRCVTFKPPRKRKNARLLRLLRLLPHRRRAGKAKDIGSKIETGHRRRRRRRRQGR